MKKAFAIMMVSAVIGTAVFAQEGKKPGMLSAGVFLTPAFGGYTASDLKDTTYFDFGFGAYFDAKYAAVTIGYDMRAAYYSGTKGTGTTNYLTLGLLGKYPIAIGQKFSIAPAVGFEYQMFLKESGLFGMTRKEMKDMYDAMEKDPDYDNFVIKLGALADFTIKGGFYVRAGVLADITLPHKDSDPKDTQFGVEIPVGVGFRF